MATSRFKQPFFIAHVVALLVTTPLTLLLTLTIMYSGMAYLRPLALVLLILDVGVASLFGGLALKRIGQSPWLGLTGFLMGLVPLILYMVLPDKISSQP